MNTSIAVVFNQCIFVIHLFDYILEYIINSILFCYLLLYVKFYLKKNILPFKRDKTNYYKLFSLDYNKFYSKRKSRSTLIQSVVRQIRLRPNFDPTRAMHARRLAVRRMVDGGPVEGASLQTRTVALASRQSAIVILWSQRHNRKKNLTNLK